MLTHFFSGATFPAGDFFAAAPRGRSLTRCGPERRCLPPGWCFFCCGPARTGVVFFFFCCGPARTLTHSLWAGAISARPWCFFFFCCGPAEPGEPITKNVWCTTSGLKRPGGATAKKNTRRKAGEGEAPCRSPAFRRGRSTKKTPCVVCFLLWPRRKVAAPNGAQPKKTLCTPGDDSKKNLETNDTGTSKKGPQQKPKKKLTHCGPGPRCSLTSFPGRLFRLVFFFLLWPLFGRALFRGDFSGRARLFFFFLLRPRADARAWAKMPPAGVVFFLLLRPRPDRGGVSFCCGPAWRLTHSL